MAKRQPTRQPRKAAKADIRESIPVVAQTVLNAIVREAVSCLIKHWFGGGG
jgi:hypothetical protein